MILSITNFTSTLYEQEQNDLDKLLEVFDDDEHENQMIYEIILKAKLQHNEEDEDDISEDELENLINSDEDIDDDDVHEYVDDKDVKDEYFKLKKELRS